MFVAVCQWSKCITYREHCFRPFCIQSPLESTLLRLQWMLGQGLWARDTTRRSTFESGEERGKRLRDALCDVTRPQGLPNRLWVGAKLESGTIKEPVSLRANLWPADWNAVSLRRQSNTSRTNTVSSFRSEKWKLLILSPSAGMNRLKQRQTKQSQLIKGCIFKQSKFK